MKKSGSLCYLLISIYILAIFAEEERSILEKFLIPFRFLKQAGMETLKRISEDEQRFLKERKRYQQVVSENVSFPCNLNITTRSKTVPKSVHELRPGDIDVIGAIGDSLTAGFGLTAGSPITVILEERGKAFPIGGEESWRNFLTIPNILKEFNPNLIGYSLKASTTIDRASQFNVAEGGAISRNTPYMTKVLIKRIRSDKRVNLAKDWKMITLFMGANDFCTELCYYRNPEIALKEHKKDLIESLRLIRDNLPRTVINLIPPPPVNILAEAVPRSLQCYVTQNMFCPCIVGKSFENKRPLFNDIIRRWQEMDLEIASYAEFDLEDFTIIAHKFLMDYKFPELSPGVADFSYLSADCFHFSQKGTSRIAHQLWNSIMEPEYERIPGQYPRDYKEDLKCPTEENPYIFTRRNSFSKH